MTVYFVAAADAELTDAIQWYDEQLPGLGSRFGSAVKETVNRIIAHPEAATVDSIGFYRVYVKGFPYKLIYSIERDDIWIAAVAHGHRKPMYWKDRL
jgi:toxin ParE2